MNLRETLKIAGVGALMAAALIAPASAAHAAPSGCSDLYRDNAYWYNCTKGSGSFRAVVRCYRIGHSTYVTRYGVWERVGEGPSRAQCLSSEETSDGRGEHRN
ncbi:hypothetical protein AB0C27_41900 [Nonomuraea sp. NPDC048882]|uniref:hypothetical protein n=1 Tax=unclassified Nonomuraea TaxID=2593643 RepID=UPI000AA8675A